MSQQKKNEDQKSSEKIKAAQEPKDVSKGPAAPPSAKTDEKPVDKVKVISQVNMTCLDGTQLFIGKEAYLSKDEYSRLKKDARGPFFKD